MDEDGRVTAGGERMQNGVVEAEGAVRAAASGGPVAKLGGGMSYEGRTVIVTGAGTGVGAAAALQLAGGGARVIVNYSRSRDEAESVAAACREAGGEAAAAQGDVASEADCRRLAEEALSRWGRIDGLINSAGTTVFRPGDDFDTLSPEDFQRIYSVNVVGAFLMTRAVTAAMKAQGRGSVVNISSIAGVMGVGSSIAYAASKGALNTLTLSLARTLAPEIRVNTVAPGFITGRWWREKMGEGYDRMVAGTEAATPLKRAGTPEDMASAAVWLLTGDVNITGEILISDAGMHLGGAPLKAR